ncbi:dephospho-CoA kinase [Cellulophaga sp. Hel_I_12]|uniref:dephospho-CoA kinase n=1 Tax=Cellulophaga sp. Hel_I_12 TaxID=1249972 RepID=UPI000648E37B|nr:dephospho-CoA kinase [Cellulophaga sp. Hel_I_12]
MVVGLTGGIGSGKSTVAELFEALGVPVYSSDKEAKKLMTRKKIRKQISSLLGEKAYLEGELNRQFIAAKVFNNASLLGELNSIVHPAVKNHFLAWKNKQNYPYVIQETAILFENGLEGRFDKIILVTAPEKVRINRVTNRDKVTVEEVKARIANQWGDEEKSKKSDFIINNIDLTETTKKVHEIHNQLLKLCK